MPIRWKTENIDVVGAKIGNNQQQQWKEKVEKAEKKLEQWANRRLSIEGRAVLIRTYALATIIYLATVFPLPDPISTRINKAIFTFLWKSGTEVVAQEICDFPKDLGGLNISNIPRTNRTFREHTEHSENIPNIQRTNRTFREHTEHSENIQNIPRTYRTFREHTEHSENIQNIQRTYRTFREHTEHSDSKTNSNSQMGKRESRSTNAN